MPRPARSIRPHVLALSWSALTIVYWLVIAGLILSHAHFPLNLGSVYTIGRAGLWVTLLPGLIGLAGLLLLLRRARAGFALLGLYSLFWAGVVLAGLPSIWNARSSFCTETVCITTPWIGRLLLLALATPFLLVALWTRRGLARGQRTLVAAGPRAVR
jgi:hypothetical protein